MSQDVNKLCLNCMQYTLGDNGVCRNCGMSMAKSETLPHHLAPRSVLNGKYLSAKVLGEGGFGITYLGWDINLEIKVAIKEYYPFGAVTRNTTVDDRVTALAGGTVELFNQGRDRFIDEARRLAKFNDLPGIVTVKDFFLENGTAYIVMEFVEGTTLKDYLEQNGGRMDEQTALELMKPLIRSLDEVHKSGVIHRDISPDNIMLTPNGQLKLIDFGAARDFNDDNKSLSVLLKPGYAPEEQYRSRGKQGPWTDIYALSATIFRAIEGDKPPEAMERLLDDTFAGFTVPVSARTSAALRQGLAVRQVNRFKNLGALYEALYGEAVSPVTMPVTTAPVQPIQPTPVMPALPVQQIQQIQPSRPAEAASQQRQGAFSAPPVAAVVPREEESKPGKPAPKADAEIGDPQQKKKRNTIIAVVSVLAVLVLSLVLIFGQERPPVEPAEDSDGQSQGEILPPTNTDPIKVGVLVSQTGSFAVNAQPIAAGIALAADYFNENGRQVELIVEDYMSDIAMAKEQFAVMVAQHDLAAVIIDFDYANEELEKLAESSGVPLIIACVALESTVNPYVFAVNVTDGRRAEALAVFAEQSLASRDIGLLYNPQSVTDVEFTDGFMRRTAGDVGVWEIDDAYSDTIAQAAETLFAEGSVNSICISGLHPGALETLWEMSEAYAYPINILTTGNMNTVDSLIDSGRGFGSDAFTYYATRYIAAPAEDVYGVIGRRHELFGEVEYSNALSGYDALQVVVQAAGFTENAAPAEVAAALREHQFRTIDGGLMYFDADGKAVRDVYVANLMFGEQRYFKVSADDVVTELDDASNEAGAGGVSSDGSYAAVFIAQTFEGAESRDEARSKIEEAHAILTEWGLYPGSGIAESDVQNLFSTLSPTTSPSFSARARLSTYSTR